MEISQRSIERMKNIKRECSMLKDEITGMHTSCKNIMDMTLDVSMDEMKQCEAGDLFVRLQRNINAIDYLLSQATDIMTGINTGSANIIYKMGVQERDNIVKQRANIAMIKKSERMAQSYQKKKSQAKV